MGPEVIEIDSDSEEEVMEIMKPPADHRMGILDADNNHCSNPRPCVVLPLQDKRLRINGRLSPSLFLTFPMKKASGDSLLVVDLQGIILPELPNGRTEYVF
jgi:hypothetical protein